MGDGDDSGDCDNDSRPNDMTSVKEDGGDDSSLDAVVMVLNASLVQQLNGTDLRLPSTYVGVRRVRPSSHDVSSVIKEQKRQKQQQQQQELLSIAPSLSSLTYSAAGNNDNFDESNNKDLSMNDSSNSNINHRMSDVSFTVTDPVTGETRRMSKVEKKALKLKMKEEAKALKKKQQEQRQRLLAMMTQASSASAAPLSPSELNGPTSTDATTQRTVSTVVKEQLSKSSEPNGEARASGQSKVERKPDHGEAGSDLGRNSNQISQNDDENRNGVSDGVPSTATSHVETMKTKHSDFTATGNKSDTYAVEDGNRNSSKKRQPEVSRMLPKPSAKALEEELADLRGDRNAGVPPVLLTSATVEHLRLLQQESLQKDQQRQQQQDSVTPLHDYYLDTEWSQKWAEELSKRIQAAHVERSREEGIRPMAYKLVPEVWSRLRPSDLVVGASSNSSSIREAAIEDSSPPSKDTWVDESEQVKSVSANQQAVNGETGKYLTRGGAFRAGNQSSDKQLQPVIKNDRADVSNASIQDVASVFNAATTKPDSFSEASATPSLFLSLSLGRNLPVLTGTNNNSIDLEDPSRRLESAKCDVLHYLNRSSDLFISMDGIKFGCDLLLYDGPRQDRHSFCGIRIYPSPHQLSDTVISSDKVAAAEDQADTETSAGKQEQEEGTPQHQYVISDGMLPSPYNLHGYVRGLNTAGKLALLATAQRRPLLAMSAVRQATLTETRIPEKRTVVAIAIVELVLEKILTAPTHKRRGRRERRKKVGMNLDKTGLATGVGGTNSTQTEGATSATECGAVQGGTATSQAET